MDEILVLIFEKYPRESYDLFTDLLFLYIVCKTQRNYTFILIYHKSLGNYKKDATHPSFSQKKKNFLSIKS